METMQQSESIPASSQWRAMHDAITLARSRAIQSEDWPLAYELRKVMVDAIRYADPLYAAMPSLNQTIAPVPAEGTNELFDYLRAIGPISAEQLLTAKAVINSHNLERNRVSVPVELAERLPST